MRQIDADAFLADESEAYMKAQIEIAKRTANTTITAERYINQLVHKKIQMLIADAPTIEPKRGEWIEVQISEQFKRMVCSECGNSYVTDMITPLEAWIDNRHRFCPNCGADMRPKGDDDE